jgi:hypothetical protein
MAIFRKYSEWNSALWNHFFPNRDENPIIWIDELVLKAASRNKIQISESSIIEDFLSCTLLSPSKLREFTDDSSHWGIDTVRINKWSDLVSKLIGQTIRTSDIGHSTATPAYFAMLCAIMYIACNLEGNITHANLKKSAAAYLSIRPDEFGELIDLLFTKLHSDVSNFESDGMTCGKQVNISRLKYHTIMRPAQREDLKDLIEISNLKWEDEPYYDYINLKLIPALANAGKRELIDIITNPEYAPCIKSILLSDLDYGKTISTCDNVPQAIQIKYKHELYLDVFGSPTFYISQNSWTPFSIYLSDGQFEIDPDGFNNEFIASDVELRFYERQELKQETGCTDRYEISSVSTSADELIFEKVSHDTYIECSQMLSGHDYIKFVKKNIQGRKLESLTSGMQKLDSLSLSNYDAYNIGDYQEFGRTNRQRNRLEDTYKLNRVGTWCSITLADNEEIYWKPDLLRDNCQPVKLKVYNGKNGRSYFHIPSEKGHTTVSGKIFISTDNGKNFRLLEGKVLHTFEWNGKDLQYYINGWGLTTIDEHSCNNLPTPTNKLSIQNLGASPLNKENILIYVLRDIADSVGCIGQRKMVNALNFILDFYGIFPTTKNRRSIIYALRTLGYLVAYYNPLTREYENQLRSPCLERTNYSINLNSNAFLVKGFYSLEMLECLLERVNMLESTTPNRSSQHQNRVNRFIRYKRPYESDNENSDEYGYECLPDMILVELDKTSINIVNNSGWTIQNFTDADKLVSMMEDMSRFESAFGIDKGGDIYHGTTHDGTEAPFMVSENDKEYLCTKRDGVYRIHKRFSDENGNLVPIPKHVARVYCQNKKNYPLLYMEEQRSNKQTLLNYAEVLFTTGMGCPSILKMALCDLNLGLNDNILTFNADREKITGFQRENCHKLQVKRGYTLATCASTHNHQTLLTLISKLAGKEIRDLSSCDQVYIRKTSSRVKLFAYKDSTVSHYVIATREGDNKVLAFSKEGKDVYYLCESGSDKTYFKAIGDDPNQIMSDIINNREVKTYDTYPKTLDPVIEADIANKRNCQQITIINY